MEDINYGFVKRFERLGYDEALSQIVETLKEEGFGVLADIDVSATLKKKLNVDFRRYRILGACNPPLAHRALSAEPMLGLLLPCNVVVAEEEGGGSPVGVISPKAIFSLVDNPHLKATAQEVEDRLTRAVEKMG